jgi:hypothetical protein
MNLFLDSQPKTAVLFVDHWIASLLAPGHNHFWRNAMNSLAISRAVGASAPFVTAASAAPLSADVSVGPESNIQKVRVVCKRPS